MAQNLLVTIATTPTELPSGVTDGSLQITMSGGSLTAPVVQTAVNGEVTFDNVAPGAYTFTAQELDSTGAALGSPASTNYTVPQTYNAPTSITVSLSPAA